VPWARFYLINVAEWESVQLYEAALNSEEYRKLAEASRDVARYYPGLYEVVRT
jgi:heme oxygenase (mycobilin-producing)